MTSSAHLCFDDPGEIDLLRRERNPPWRRHRLALRRELPFIVVLAALSCNVLAIGMDLNGSTITSPPSKPAELPKEAPRTIKTPTVLNHTVSPKHHVPKYDKIASDVRRYINVNVDPCDNFYEFACGGFIESTKIPPYKAKMGSSDVLEDVVLKRVKALVESQNEPNDTVCLGSVRDLYKSCMLDTSNEPSVSVKRLRKILENLGGWPVLDNQQWNESAFDWPETMYKFAANNFSTDYLIKLDTIIEDEDGAALFISIDQPESFGIPTWKLLKTCDTKIIQAYRNYMVDVAQFMGAEEDYARDELEKSLAFEIELAKIHVPKSPNTSSYNWTTLDDLAKNSSIPWKEYIENLVPLESVIDKYVGVSVSVPSYVTELEELLNKTSKKILANYLIWRGLNDVVHLNRNLTERRFEFDAVLTGVTARQPRWQKCVRIVTDKYPKCVDEAYVRKHFDKTVANEVGKIAMNVKEQYENMFNQAEWMNNNTRKFAIDKLHGMLMYIGGEYIEDKKQFERSKEELLGLLESNRNQNESQSQRPKGGSTKFYDEILGFDGERDIEVKPSYDLTTNTIAFPPGFLQSPFFVNDRPSYINYGAIGIVIAHEIAHAFDTLGIYFNEEGESDDQWEKDIASKYFEKIDCLVQQYENYSDRTVGLRLNGFTTRDENLADNVGLKAIYRAYINWTKVNQPEPKLPGLDYTREQMFWISTASGFCTKYNLPKLESIVAGSDVYPPSEHRVIGSVSNMPEFSRDFNCSKDARMNPEKKCSVW